jgi:ABC-2 type transport system permease protein
MRMSSTLHKMWRSKFWWLLLLVIIALANFLGSMFHSRFDLTREKRYTLSKATKDLLRKLDEPVTIDVFLKGSFPAGFRKLANATTELLQEFKEYGKSRIVYNFHSPQDIFSGNTKYSDTLVGMGASPINLTVQLEAGQTQQYVFPVAWIRYKDRSIIVDLYSGGKRLITPDEMNVAEAMMEYNFVSSIKKLLSDTDPIVGYITGNGQPDPAGPYVADLLNYTLGSNYRVLPFNLALEPNIPDTCKAIFVVKPTLKFTEDEKFKLDQYVMHGGKVVWVIDNLAAEMDSFQIKGRTIAYERDLNLTDILFRYGARINADLIMDLQSDLLPFQVGGSADNPQYEFLKWNYFPLFESKSNHPINKNLRLVASRFVSSIDTVKAPGIRKTFLLSSSANSRIIGSPALISGNENRNAPEDALFKRSNIPAAVLLEGKFTSHYNNRVPRAVQDSMRASGTPFVPANVAENKMIIIADGDIVMNAFSARQNNILPMGMNPYTVGTQFEYQFANRDFVLNCVEYLISDASIIEMRNKDFVLRVLDSKKIDEERTMWQLIAIGLPIILVMLFGLIYQQVRKQKFAK